MKEESGHIIYSIEEIHKYFSGKLSAPVMHAMEKDALNDPLLADAMEGFAASPTFKNEEKFLELQQELDILKNRIATRSVHPKYNNWWQVAAAAIILVGSCFTFYAITNHTTQQKEAGVLQQPVLQTSTLKDSIVADDLKIANAPAASIKPVEKIAAPKKNKAVENNDAEKKTMTATTFALAAAPANRMIEERIAPQKKTAPAFRNTLQKDTSGNNSRPASQVNILYEKGATPIVGWSAYLNYLESQLSYSTYDNGKEVTGEMVIEFKVDTIFNAIPTEFYFEKSINADVNDAVKQLIQNAGQWKIENNSIQGIIKLKIIF